MSKLALFGGTPLRTTPFTSYNPIGEEEKARVAGVLDSGLLSGFIAEPGEHFLGGPEVRELEELTCEMMGARFAVTMNSATSALYAAVGAAGLGPGDEMIVTPYTMSASATAALAWGAIPVFADIDPETFCLDPAAVEALVSERTRAIMAVDLFGHPADFAALKRIAAQHDLILIEDAAQAPMASLDGKQAATLGDIGILSLNRHKHIHCGEGGIALTDDPALARRLQLIRNHGEVVVEPGENLASMIGQNYRMTEVHAAIAIEQMKKLPGLVARRQTQADEISRALDGHPLLTPPVVRDGVTHAYYVYATRLRRRENPQVSRDVLARALSAEGLPATAGYVTPLYELPLYQQRIGMGSGKGDQGWPFSLAPHVDYAACACPVVERLETQELCLLGNVHGALSDTEMADTLAILEKIGAGADQLHGVTATDLPGS